MASKKAAARARAKPEPVTGATPATPTEQLAKQQSRFFEVRKSGIQGRGAFAIQKVRKGQRVIEYEGERVSAEEADRRYDESSMKRHHTFLFTLDRRTVIDGAMNGNESIYINHSCDPNCEAVITDGRIYIHAVRTIQPGEELGYDYQYERTGESDDELEKFYKCRCGAPNCRGSIMKPATPSGRKRSGGGTRSPR
ncbi:MAG: SET domain-containing protein [Gemmatimonadaceae bacterium]